ncbi:MAG: PA2169 family four-helix-bundle protein [Chitinophagaceae bacterium]
MPNNDNLTEVLNDLIRINNDRIEGYKRAVKEAADVDVDLKAIFSRMADESRQYLSELTREVVKLGGEPAEGTTASGKIYRAWMDVKATFTGSDRAAVLTSCEFGEDAAQKAYHDALTTDEALTTEVRQLIANQQASLKVSHDTIKKYRDMHKIADSDNLTSSGNLANTDNTGRSTGSDKFSDSASSSNSRTGDTGTFGKTSNSGTGKFDDLDDDIRNSGNLGGSGNLRNL